MKSKVLLIKFLLFSIIASSYAQVKVVEPLTENLVNPVGLDTRQPRFSWKLKSENRNVLQKAYELKVAESLDNLKSNTNLVWNSQKVESDSSVFVAFKGTSLKSNKKYYWQVRVWDNTGNVSEWSMPASWQMAFLSADDWKARWISPGFVEDSVNRPCPVLRKEIKVDKEIASATAYITSKGLYEAKLHGKKIGDAFLTPGWTAYRKRTQYQVYDVTELLQKGRNAIGVTLANGWYRGFLAWERHRDEYGKELGFLFQLEVSFTDGSTETIISDNSWKSNTGEITSSEIYHGESIDHRKELNGWLLAGYDDSKWPGVKLLDYKFDDLVATYNEPVKKQEEFKPVKVFTSPSGEQLIDFGQNLVGNIQMKISGKAGDKITVKFAEVLDKNGNFYTENLRAAKSTDVFTLKGGNQEVFEPKFTFHGFRYIKIEGLKGKINPDNIVAFALYSDMKPTGTFTCSNALINQLQHNIQWGQRGNFLDVPTDCPQRDERLGWTGDAQAFSRTATFNMDVHNFFSKWLKDVALDQNEEGAVPFVVPNVLGKNAMASTGWADVATIAPWNMYLAYGDRRILQDQYASMKAWVNYMKSKSSNYLWNTGFHFGDWLFYRPNDDNDGRSAVTDKYLIAQCFWAHSTQLLINAAQVLGKTDDVKFYSEELPK
ncbi:MAG: family 78 glycoside hydrolase catalytic domain [Bacteroidales bacterium]